MAKKRVPHLFIADDIKDMNFFIPIDGYQRLKRPATKMKGFVWRVKCVLLVWRGQADIVAWYEDLKDPNEGSKV